MDDCVTRARENFLQGYSCAQAVLLAFAPYLGMEEEFALRLSSSFGAGMGRLREVCGALSSLLMLEGLLEGYADPHDAAAKTAHYARVQALAGRFRQEMGSILCRDLLGPQKASTSPVPEARTDAYYAARPCLRAVECAARMGQELLEQKKLQKK